MSDLVYLYGFVPSGTVAPGPELTGIAEAPVTLHPMEGFCAAVSRVDADHYSAPAIDQRMHDLSWVAEQGIAHERVVAWFVDHAQILPASLFTLYSSDPALASSAREQASRIVSELERLRGKREWDIKVSCQYSKLAEHAARHSDVLSALDQEIASATPGRRYLVQKKRGDILKQEVSRVARQLAADVVEGARTHAHSVVALPLPPAGQDLPVVLHAALLVENAREADLVKALSDAASRLEPEGVTVAFSGPWAPYRFVEHD